MPFPDLFQTLLAPSFLTDWKHEVFEEKKLQVKILRLDAQHPHIGGNKLYKLYHNLEKAKAQNQTTLLTFGGAYSNHLRATACAGKFLGFKTIGVVRGEETRPLNPVLSFCKSEGMHLHYISRTAYREKHQPHTVQILNASFGDFYLIPEGGSNALALQGCAHIPKLILEQNNHPPDWIILAAGTGGTSAGILLGKDPHTKVLSVSALKGGSFLRDDMEKLLRDYLQTQQMNPKIATSKIQDLYLETSFHEGGYAKKSSRLLAFMEEFHSCTQIQLDHVYTGKSFLATLVLAQNNFFKPHQHITLIHTGGVF